jgi:hypothetical protein
MTCECTTSSKDLRILRQSRQSGFRLDCSLVLVHTRCHNAAGIFFNFGEEIFKRVSIMIFFSYSRVAGLTAAINEDSNPRLPTKIAQKSIGYRIMALSTRRYRSVNSVDDQNIKKGKTRSRLDSQRPFQWPRNAASSSRTITFYFREVRDASERRP